jgi:nicotinate-nucleotide pyrophosphorylase (carboxylating)
LAPKTIHFRVIAKENGVSVGAGVWNIIGEISNAFSVPIESVEDGRFVCPGEVIVRGQGAWSEVLKWERTALNIMGYLSGIATVTRTFADRARSVNPDVQISETRKVLPGYRDLAKYAVRRGGGVNHRRDLSDSVLIKENHIAATGGLSAVLERCAHAEFPLCEIELPSPAAVDEVTQFSNRRPLPSLRWLMLDNFSPEEVAQATAKLRAARGLSAVRIEVSGGIHLENLQAYARSPIDRISIGALTHSVKALDVSLLVEGA